MDFRGWLLSLVCVFINNTIIITDAITWKQQANVTPGCCFSILLGTFDENQNLVFIRSTYSLCIKPYVLNVIVFWICQMNVV